MQQPESNQTKEPLLTLCGVGVRLGGRLIIDQIDLRIDDSEIVTLIGPNGAGKSTLVKVILGLVKPAHGTIAKRTGLRAGYMPQQVNLDHTLPLSVERFLTLSKASRGQSPEKVMHQVRVNHLRTRAMQALSGGELQRVLLARALLRNPHLLVLDEPVQGVDINGQTELYELINQIRQQYHCAVLMVSHDLHLVMSATDRVVCINHHICCSGHPEHIGNDPAYQQLFGTEAEALALYSHHHDHHHDDQGNVIEGPQAHG